MHKTALVKCSTCGKEIQRELYAIKQYKHFYCSNQCKRSIVTKPRSTTKLFELQELNYCTLLSKSTSMGYIAWLCKCKCGQEFSRRQHSLIYKIDKNEIISCGCQKISRNKGKNYPFWRGCGSLSQHYFGKTRLRAEQRGFEFTITIEQAWQKFLDQNQKCALSGIDINITESRRNGEIMTASLDRIDSNKGYTPENIQWVHKDLNLIKKDYDNTKFINWCHLISKHNPTISYTETG